MENCKEYLEKQPDGKYALVLRGDLCKESDILIPEGAEVATLDGKALYFWNPSENKTFVDDHWVTCGTDVCSFDDFISDESVLVIWQRATNPEELPFVDDEPKYTDDEVKYMNENGQGRLQSLNDQYAEIEQVRQDGLKFDNGKPRHSLLPKGSISSIIAVLEFGAKKYEANNWQKVDNAKERYYDAAMRHIDSWWNGEKFDQETGIHHLAHAATNLFFLKWFDDKENNNE